jgi:hypothetical protein
MPDLLDVVQPVAGQHALLLPRLREGRQPQEPSRHLHAAADEGVRGLPGPDARHMVHDLHSEEGARSHGRT